MTTAQKIAEDTGKLAASRRAIERMYRESPISVTDDAEIYTALHDAIERLARAEHLMRDKADELAEYAAERAHESRVS
jgi:hypothetical protein